MKHTKGDWFVRFINPEDIEAGFFVQAPKKEITHPYDIEILGEEHDVLYPTSQKLADAHLISAAPDILEALDYVKRTIKSAGIEGYFAMVKINEAIAKAKGKTT